MRNDMTSRERMLTAMSCGQPDRVPLHLRLLGFTPLETMTMKMKSTRQQVPVGPRPTRLRPTAFTAMAVCVLAAVLQTGCEPRTDPQPSGRPASPPDQSSDGHANDEALVVARNVVLFQLPSGGWPKRDRPAQFSAKPLTAEQVDALRENDPDYTYATMDNGMAFRQISFLAGVYSDSLAAGRDEEALADIKAAALKGIDYLLAAQYDNGGWPQAYPYTVDYARHITLNDDVMNKAIRLLSQIAAGDGAFAFVDRRRRESARRAVAKGIDCLLRCQVVVHGVRTVWCQQHDEEDFRPRAARPYEPAALTAGESLGVLKFLMQLEDPSPEIVEAVTSAIAWYDGPARLTGIRQTKIKDPARPNWRDKVIVEDPSAPHLWARFYYIGPVGGRNWRLVDPARVNQPLFGDNDGAIYTALHRIGNERRTGYDWYREGPRDVLAAYPAWRATWAPDGYRLNSEVLASPWALDTDAADTAAGVAVDAEGNVYVAGTTGGNLGGANQGDTDVFVAKFSPTGIQQWVCQVGTVSSDWAADVAVNDQGVCFVAGSTFGGPDGDSHGDIDAFVAKIDPHGHVAWIRQFSEKDRDRAYAVAADARGNCIVAWTSIHWPGIPVLSHGESDVFITMFDGQGNRGWTTPIKSDEPDFVSGLTIDAGGNTYVVGRTDGALTGENHGYEDAYLAKLNHRGRLLWTRQFGSDAPDAALGVALAPDGQCLVVGATQGDLAEPNAGGYDVFVAAFNANGSRAWLAQVGTEGDDEATGVSIDPLGTIHVTGTTAGNLGAQHRGAQDVFVAQLDEGGRWQWFRQVGSSAADLAVGLAGNRQGICYIAGHTQGDLAGTAATNSTVFILPLATAHRTTAATSE